MESRSIVRRRTPRWRRTQYLTTILGAAALLVAMGSGSVFAADPSSTADDLELATPEVPIVRTDDLIFEIDPIETVYRRIIVAPRQPVTSPVEVPGVDADVDPNPVEGEDPTEVEDPAENPGEAPDADDVPDPTEAEDPTEVEDPTEAEDPTTDPGTCAPDIEEPQGDPADVEVPGVTDPDDMGDPADPADCTPAVEDPTEAEDPTTDPGTCAPDIEEPQGDPADVEVPGVTDPDDMGDPADPADCTPAVEDPADAETPDQPEGADASESGSDHSAHHQVAIADTESTLPATDTDPGLDQAGVDPRMAALLAVLTAIALGAAERREASSRR